MKSNESIAVLKQNLKLLNEVTGNIAFMGIDEILKPIEKDLEILNVIKKAHIKNDNEFESSNIWFKTYDDYLKFVRWLNER